MFGLLLVYFIGKWFYKLADTYNRNKWFFSILSVVVFFGIQFFIRIVFGIFFIHLIDSSNQFIFSIATTVIAGLGIYGMYHLLEKNWKKNSLNPLDEIDNLGKE